MLCPAAIKNRSLINYTLIVLFVAISFFVINPRIHAADLQEAYVRLDRMSVSTATGGLICAKPGTTGSISDVQVAFPNGNGTTTGYSVNTTAGNWTVTTSNLPSGATAWPNISTATAVSSQVVTFAVSPATSVTAGTLYCFNFSATSTLTSRANAASSLTGTITTRSSGTPVDTKTFALATVSNDQVEITASVPPTFTFSLGANTDTFAADLSTSVTSTTGVTASVGTNAANGWIAWVKGANNDGGFSSLYSTSSTARISRVSGATIDDTPESLAATTGYVLDVNVTDSGTAGTGTVSQSAGYGAEYNGTDTNSGGTVSMNFEPVASANGPTDNDQLTFIARAKITSLQKAAGDYKDTLTIVAAARY